MDWIKRFYDYFKKIQPAKAPEPVRPPDFARVKPRSSQVTYRAYGIVYGLEKSQIIHRFEAKRFSRRLLYSMPSSGRKLAELLLDSERTEENKKLLRFLTCYSLGEMSITPTHFVTISYEFIRDGSRVILFQMPLNFRSAGYDSDAVCRACCEFAASIILRDELRHKNIALDRQNLALTTVCTETKIFWLAMLFTRYRQFGRG